MTVIQFPARGRFLKAKKSDSPPQKTGRNTRTYLEVRDREYLFEEEVKAMIQVAFKGRWGHRDSTLILMGYRHGLRISELVNLRWQQINFNTGHIHVRRVKGSKPSVHPLSGEEMRALGQLRRDYPDSAYIFVSERGGPMTPDAARKMIRKSGEGAKLQFPVHPHMLRHGCGYYLAAKG
jgi:type 1 fimbriae regulatory protein FimB/type 1 fimbriae regulatory protein FimE